MATDNVLRSYGDVSRKEDVLGMVEILTATESSVHNMLGKTKAIDMVHSTLTDTLASVASNAVAEGGDYTNKALTTPTRLTNLVQLVAVPFSVTRTQREIEHYHGEDELSRQTTKAMKDWHNSTEFDLVRGSLVSGASGTIPKMNGVINAISKSTNTTAHNSGTVFSASILRGLMTANWDNSNGDVATDAFTGSFLKNVMDSFTNKTNITSDGANTNQIINVVDVFETSAGNLRVHMHRYIQQSADATSRILAIRPEKLKVAYLTKPYIDTGLARSGDYDRRAIVGKMTTEVRNQDSNWFAAGFKKD